VLDGENTRRMDRYPQCGLAAALGEVKDSGNAVKKDAPFRCGCIIGSGIGGLNESEDQHTRYVADGPRRISPFVIPKMIANAASGSISIHFGLSGHNTAVATACSSAAHALCDALRSIRTGYSRAMQLALKDARLDPHDIQYINAHGTSTPQGDIAETKAMKDVFGSHARKLAVSSTKSMLGHTLGASGGIELIASIMSIRTGVA